MYKIGEDTYHCTFMDCLTAELSTRTSMYTYHRSVAASRTKGMFWLLTALKND